MMRLGLIMPVVGASSKARIEEELLIFYIMNSAKCKVQRRLGGACKGHCAGVMSFYPRMHGALE